MGTTREFLVGLVFFGLLILLGVFTIILADVRLGPEPPSIVVSFDDVAGLEEGDDVWINGYRSGKVASVTPDIESNQLQVKVYFDFVPILYGNARFGVKPASPLGGRILAIQRGMPRAMRRTEEERLLPELLDPNAAHKGEATADVLTEAAQFIAENREGVREAIEGFRVFARDLAVSGPATMQSLNAAAARIDAVVKDIHEGPVGGILRDETVGLKVKQIVDNVDATAEGLKVLLADRQLREDVHQGVGALRVFVERLNTAEGTLARFIDDPALYDSALRMLGDVEGIAKRLNTDAGLGVGLLGNKAWGHFESSLASIDDLLADVRTAKDNRNTPLGAILKDEDIVPGLRNSVTTISDMLADARENSPIATFAGFLFSAF